MKIAFVAIDPGASARFFERRTVAAAAGTGPLRRVVAVRAVDDDGIGRTVVHAGDRTRRDVNVLHVGPRQIADGDLVSLAVVMLIAAKEESEGSDPQLLSDAFIRVLDARKVCERGNADQA